MFDSTFEFILYLLSYVAVNTKKLVHSFTKTILHLWYGKGELFRLSYNYSHGYTQTYNIERSLLQSNLPMLRQGLFSVEIDDYIHCIQRIKKIEAISFFTIMKDAVLTIRSYADLYTEMERVRKLPFNVDDPEHVSLLRQIWKILIPNETFALKGKSWTQIGFQGLCPITDFRGMGMLGARNFHYLVTYYPDLAKKLLSSSWHPDHEYSLAITGINLTALVLRLMREGCLKPHFYNAQIGALKLSDIHFVYVCVFASFNTFWTSQKRDIMMFNVYMEDFEKNLRLRILQKDFIFEKP